MLYENRREGGRALATRLLSLAREPDLLVLALPRGGVPVGFEVARALGAPLDVFVVRKLGVPWHRELAMGAIASGGGLVLDEALLREEEVDADDVREVIAEEQEELQRREQLYRGDRPPAPVEGHCVLLVDDGLATGSTMLAAVRALRKRSPRRLVCAAPVGTRYACDLLERELAEVVCPMTPIPFRAVGNWYRDFSDTTDDEVRALLAAAQGPQPGAAEQLHP